MAGNSQEKLECDLQANVEARFATKVLSNLHELMKNGEFCDVVLHVDNDNFTVHKAVLVSSSAYFRAMFCDDMSEKHQAEVNIKGVTSDSMALLLDYCYTGKIIITDENVEDLLQAADLLGFADVKETCAHYLMDQLVTENCLGIYQLAERFSCMQLSQKAESFMKKNFAAVSKYSEILSLDAMCLKSIIESDDICIDSEFQLLQFIFEWVETDMQERRKMIAILLTAVKLCFIPPKKLHEISRRSLIQDDLVLQNVIEKAMFCHCECAGISMRPSCSSWLYVLGGERSFMKETKSIEYFDCQTIKWKGAAKLPSTRVSCAVVVLGRKLYVIGGIQRKTKLNSVECYDIFLGKWKNVAHLVICCGEVKAAALNGNIYVAGGSCSRQNTCSYVEKYCPVIDRWTKVSNMTHKRRRFALVPLDESLYAVGGFDDDLGYISSVESYSPNSDQWESKASMTYQRCDFGAVQLSNYIYVVGGVNEHHGSLSSVERYNHATDTWETMTSMSRPRGCLAVALYCGKIFAINGTSEDMSVENSVECYDEVTNSWKLVKSTNVARSYAAAFVLDFLIK